MSEDWFEGGGSGSEVDLAALFDSEVPTKLRDLAALGALVSLGTTRDGGALSVTVTMDGRWRRGYFRESEEALEWLDAATLAVAAAASRQSASAERGGRTRRSRGL